MESKVIIAKRVALELEDNSLVNLGVGVPTLVPNFLPPGITVYLQTENGLIGIAAKPAQGMEHGLLVDAGGNCTGAVPGAAALDSNTSFGLIRGGHLDVTVLGGLQVNGKGQLANWMIPGKIMPGMGGAMDLVTGTKRVIVAMTHTAKGQPKIVKNCELPLTSSRRVSLIVTDMAVIEPTEEGLVLREVAPGVTKEQVIAATGATLIVPENVPVMAIQVE